MSLSKSQSERSYQDDSLDGGSSHTLLTDKDSSMQDSVPIPSATPFSSRPAREKRKSTSLGEEMGYIFYDARSIPEGLRSPKQAKMTPQARNQSKGIQTEIHKLPIWEIPSGWHGDLSSIPKDHRLSDNAVGRICFLYTNPASMQMNLKTDFYYDGTLQHQRLKCGLPFLDSEGTAMRVRGHLLCGSDRVPGGPYTEKNWESMKNAERWSLNPGFAISVTEGEWQDQTIGEHEKSRETAQAENGERNIVFGTETAGRLVDSDLTAFNIKDDAYCWKVLRVLVAHEPQHKARGARNALRAREDWLRSCLADVAGNVETSKGAIVPSLEETAQPAVDPTFASKMDLVNLRIENMRLKAQLQTAKTMAEDTQTRVEKTCAVWKSMKDHVLTDIRHDLVNLGDRAARYIAILGDQGNDAKAEVVDAGTEFLQRFF